MYLAAFCYRYFVSAVSPHDMRWVGDGRFTRSCSFLLAHRETCLLGNFSLEWHCLANFGQFRCSPSSLFIFLCINMWELTGNFAPELCDRHVLCMIIGGRCYRVSCNIIGSSKLCIYPISNEGLIWTIASTSFLITLGGLFSCSNNVHSSSYAFTILRGIRWFFFIFWIWQRVSHYR